MKKILVLVFVVLSFGAAYGQDEQWVVPSQADYPKAAETGNKIADFIPAGFEVVKSVSGDLSADGVADAAVHIKGTSKKFQNPNDGLGGDIFDTNPRILLILIRDKAAGTFRLAEQSNTFIIPPDSPVSVEPFSDMSIRNGILQVDFELWQSAGGWGRTDASYKFRYRGGEFQLIGVDRRDSMRNTGETEMRSYNFLTNRLKISTGNFTEEKKEKVTWKTLPKRGLKALKTFPKPFEWEIERDTFI
jgi:hypothetical protein